MGRVAVSLRIVLRGLLAVLPLLAAGAAEAGEPAKVIVGSFVNQILDLSFKERRYLIDFWVWFRWEPEGTLVDYKPLESFELINGRIETRSSVVEKKIGKVNYASARVTATISQAWELNAFPLDSHRLHIHLEDSGHAVNEMVFEADLANSRLGKEIDLSGWTVSGFDPQVTTTLYETNYGDISLPTHNHSRYSRFTFSMNLQRENNDAAMKLLGTMFFAPLVAFAAFLIKPTDVNTRFGVGVGALFAVATSAVIAASAVPDSSALTLADTMHMMAMAFIFASLAQSATCMKWNETGHETRARQLDRWSLLVFPLMFVLLCVLVVLRAR
jgi:hypothetical protein